MSTKKYIATEDTQLDIKGLVQDIKNSVVAGGGAGGVLPHLTITAPTGAAVVAANDKTEIAAVETGTSGIYQTTVPHLGDWAVSVTKDGRTGTRNVSVVEVKDYKVRAAHGHRYGYRIKESEGSPAARVEYLFDAEGMIPAHMDFSRGVFDYGDFGDLWFVKENKPCMLRRDGTVDYYMDPDDYDRTEDGTASDVSNTSYDGNAMSEIPKVWVKRYSDGEYRYNIFSDVQYDEDYKDDAYVRADGSSGDHFYYSMFGGSGGASMIRSLAGQTRSGSLTMQQEMDGAKTNGALWNIHTWSRWQLIRDLCVLMGKSTETQAVFGNGNCRSATSASGILATGTLKNMGQFYGYNNATNQVKVFHIEAFWGDMWDRIAGILVNNYEVWAKMTPEGDGYQVSSLTGYTDTGIAVPASMSQSYLSAHATNRYGSFPTGASGSGSTFYCDGAWSASGLMCLLVGASAHSASAVGGGFTWASDNAPSDAGWNHGCGLSCDEPAATA